MKRKDYKKRYELIKWAIIGLLTGEVIWFLYAL